MRFPFFFLSLFHVLKRVLSLGVRVRVRVDLGLGLCLWSAMCVSVSVSVSVSLSLSLSLSVSVCISGGVCVRLCPCVPQVSVLLRGPRAAFLHFTSLWVTQC
jgi:hypothetical protein